MAELNDANSDEESNTSQTEEHESNSQLWSESSASQTKEKTKWKLYQKGMLAEQNLQKLRDGVKSRDGPVIADALCKHYYGFQQQGLSAHEHLEAAQTGGLITLKAHIFQMLGLSQEVLEGEEEGNSDDFNSIEESLQCVEYRRHLAMFKAARAANTERLAEEIQKLMEYVIHLRCWPLNFGLFENQENEGEMMSINLREEYQAIAEMMDLKLHEIDTLLAKHLFRVCCECNSDEAKLNDFKLILEEQLQVARDVLDEVQKNCSSQRYEDMNDTDPDTAFSEKTHRSHDSKDGQMKKLSGRDSDSKLQQEVDEAMLLLQMLRLRQMLSKGMHPTVSVITPEGKRQTGQEMQTIIQGKQKTYLPVAINECKSFIEDAKQAIAAAKELIHKQIQNAKQKPSKESQTPTTEQQVSSQLLKLEMNHKSRRQGNTFYIMHKGRKVPLKRQKGWTDRSRKAKSKSNEANGDSELEFDFKEMLTGHTNLRLYISRLQAVLQELYTDLAEAEAKLKSIQPKPMKTPRSMHLDRNAMLEVRRYAKPPALLHSIVQATFLLLGEHEYTTMDWETCQQLLIPGSARSPGLVKRVNDFNPSQVHPEIAKRAHDILQQVNFDAAIRACPAAGAFYVWTRGQVENIHLGDKSANPDRQVQILDDSRKTRR